MMRLRLSIHVLLLLGCSACAKPEKLDALNELIDGGEMRDSGALDSGAPDAGTAESCTEGTKIGTVCSVGQGACERAGTYMCTEGALACSAKAGAPSTELCGTKHDEDCDGKVDEAPKGGCCDDHDCKELEVCKRAKGDAFAAGSCAPLAGQNAECTKDGTKVVCVCKPGYEGDGKTCERNACIPLAGEDPPCGKHERCERVAAGKKTCTCEKGFDDCEKDSANGCEVELASNANNCGACRQACADGLECAASECDERVTAMSMGISSTLAIASDGTVLGAGHVDGQTPTTFSRLSRGNAIQISAGPTHSCVVRQNGAAACWGSNTHLALGAVDTDASSAELPALGATAISAGTEHTCMIGKEGKIYCWGQGLNGEFGDGVTRDRGFAGRSFAEATDGDGYPVPYIQAASAIQCGDGLNCALTIGGVVYCWGYEGGGAYKPELVRDKDGDLLADATAIAGGNNFACALRSNGTVVCWGRGALGTDEQPTDRNHYVAVNIADVRAIAAGQAHACALLGDGGVRCWGDNSLGQLGTGDSVNEPMPTAVLTKDLGPARSIYAGSAGGGTCMEVRSGRVFCWGGDYYGQLGLGGPSTGGVRVIPTPTEVTSWP